MDVKHHVYFRNPKSALTDDTSCLDITPWTLSTPTVQSDLTKFKKDTTNPETYEHFICSLLQNILHHKTFSLMVQKTEDGVVVVAVFTKHIHKPFTC